MTIAQSQEFDVSRAFKVASEAADLGRDVLLNYFGKLSHVTEKYMAGLVSEADQESEKVITQHLRKNFPEFDILGEEFGLDKGKEDRLVHGQWIVDPLDGTTNYVHRFPIFCISIGLRLGDDLVVGIIDLPKLGQRYHAIRGQGAFCDGQLIRTSSITTMKDALVATGFYNLNEEALKTQLEIFTETLRVSRDVRRPGAAAYDLCLVAHGVFEAFWESNLQPWDTAAGTLLVREAGGIVTNYKGDFFQPEMKNILAGNSVIHREMGLIISK